MIINYKINLCFLFESRFKLNFIHKSVKIYSVLIRNTFGGIRWKIFTGIGR